MDNKDYITNAFTKEEDQTNLAVNNLKVSCLTSTNNQFELDSEGNLSVKSLTAENFALTSSMILNVIYPVGSIYLSVNNQNPSGLLGGTWEPIKDRFLLASGDTYPIGSTGGEASHTLSLNEMPRHSHKTSAPVGNNGGSAAGYLWSFAMANWGQQYTTDEGGNAAHNNMPPYLAINVWKRTA